MIITVYPTKASALNVKHPHGPKMVLEGAPWPKDGFTGRRLRDGSVTEDETKAYVMPNPDEAASVVAKAAESEPADAGDRVDVAPPAPDHAD